MIYSNMRKSIEIFEKYDLGDRTFQTEHDILYGPDVDANFSLIDESALYDLGWFIDKEYECWCCFT